MTSKATQPGQLLKLERGSILDGRFEILELLGEGGFASVYKARQILMDRFVALKLLHTRRSQSSTFEQRFAHEAKLAGRLRHPNVVTIYDFGFAGDAREPFIVMEFLDGHDLRAELQQNGPLQPERIARLFAGPLDALSAGHEAGIVHKDLKPANLFLIDAGTERETLMVLDFGVARLYGEEDERMTGTGQYFGTPQYLAPEYIETQTVTPAIDVYQMGLILAEALTGSSPIQANTPYKLLAAHIDGKIEIEESVLNSVLGPIIIKAVNRDPAGRHKTAKEFAQVLAEADLSDLSLNVRYEPPPQPPVITGLTTTGGGNALFPASDTGEHSDAFATTVAGEVPTGRRGEKGNESSTSSSGRRWRSGDGADSLSETTLKNLEAAARKSGPKPFRLGVVHYVCGALLLAGVALATALLSSGWWEGKGGGEKAHPTFPSNVADADRSTTTSPVAPVTIDKAPSKPTADVGPPPDATALAGDANIPSDDVTTPAVGPVDSGQKEKPDAQKAPRVPRAPRVCWRYRGNPAFVVPKECRRQCSKGDGSRLRRSPAFSKCDVVMNCRTFSGCQPP